MGFLLEVSVAFRDIRETSGRNTLFLRLRPGCLEVSLQKTMAGGGAVQRHHLNPRSAPRAAVAPTEERENMAAPPQTRVTVSHFQG